MTHRALTLVGLLALAALAPPASAAPIDIVAQLDPGQSGPVYAWSLMLRIDAGYSVGGFIVLAEGLDSFLFSGGDPAGISYLDSDFLLDVQSDGSGLNGLFVNAHTNASLTPTPGVLVKIGTFYGPHATAPPVALFDCETYCGFTVYDPLGNQLPPQLFTVRAVPEASQSLALALLPLALAALSELERGAVRAAKLDAAPFA